MSVPEFKYFYLSSLEFFKDGEIHTKKEISELNADYFKLSGEDKEEKTGKGTALKYKDRTNWAIDHMFHAGLLKKEGRGNYLITDEGKKILEEKLDCIDHNFLLQYESYEKYRNKNKNGQNEIDNHIENKPHELETIEEKLSPTERLEGAYDEINTELSEELYDMIINNSPRFFEKLVVKLLIKMGYGLNEEYGEVTPYAKDGGIDGIIFEDELGLSQIHIQAKQHTNPIGQKDMKEFAYTLEHGIQKGVMITTSSFTKGAIEISEESDAQIVLIDGKRLTQLMIKHDVGVFTEYTYSIKKIDSDFFEED